MRDKDNVREALILGIVTSAELKRLKGSRPKTVWGSSAVFSAIREFPDAG
jgi:hypothetical protein